MLTKIWNDFCDDVLSSKKRKSKEIDFEKGPVKDFLTSLGWVKYGSHRLAEQHPIQFATANHYADFALFLEDKDYPEIIIELKRPAKRKEDRDASQLEDYMLKEECSFGLLVGEVLELYFVDFTKPRPRAELITNIKFDKDNSDAKQLISLLLAQGYDTLKMREHCLQQLKLNETVMYWNSKEGKDEIYSYILENSSLPKSLKDKLQSMMSIKIHVHQTIESQKEAIPPSISPESTPQGENFRDRCISRLMKITRQKLVKKTRNTYISKDGKTGYIFRTSKIYNQGKREKYWYSYKRMKEISNCKNQFNVFGCNDENTIIVLPVSEIESRIESLNYSKDSYGNPSYWHIVFFKDNAGNMTWLLSKPEIQEISITHFLLKD